MHLGSDLKSFAAASPSPADELALEAPVANGGVLTQHREEMWRAREEFVARPIILSFEVTAAAAAAGGGGRGEQASILRGVGRSRRRR